MNMKLGITIFDSLHNKININEEKQNNLKT